jgi:peptide deformylase
LKIVYYPHPTLRHKSTPLRRVNGRVKDIVREMFALMYEAKGVGLAANQVDLPFRLFVTNLAGAPEEGEELVFINPVIERPKGKVEQEEGCLSLPDVYAPVRRPERIAVSAYDLSGNEINCEIDGMFARVVQHETDHLDGVLFVDRLSETVRFGVEEALHDFETEFLHQRERDAIPSDDEIHNRLAELESQFC